MALLVYERENCPADIAAFYTKVSKNASRHFIFVIREVKHDVYGKRQTAKMKLLPSVFSSLYSRIKIFVFAVNSKRHFSIFA